MIYKRLTDFKLNAFYSHVPEFGRSMETGLKLNGMFEWINAKVPGSIHSDLLKAGLIRDPYYEMQSLESEWVKDRWWVYETNFEIDPILQDKNVRLRINGTDYKGHIYLNNQKLGEQKGMYVPFVSNITQNLRSGESNCLKVMLESAPDEMGQIGYTNRTFTQKARFTYKWDWSPRLVQLGLYDDVLLESFGKVAINYAHISPVYINGKTESGSGKWVLGTEFECEAFCDTEACFKLALYFGEKLVAEESVLSRTEKGCHKVKLQLQVHDPQLWYPNGSGPQPLYGLKVEISDESGLSDYKEYDVGFRTLEYIQCENSTEGSLPYNLVLNGKKVFIKGVNFTPLDVMYGAVDEGRYREALEMAKAANINLIRVWGGGLVEKEAFYRECDRLGLLVWQEFIQSSSGISNVPSKFPEFLSLAKKTAVEAVKVKRNHVSLTYWSGGNELTDENGIPSTYEDENIKILSEVVTQYDPQRLMLPTSASGPLEFLDVNRPGENHDVHGPWKYMGVEEHYTMYNKSDSQLHSEFGVDGVTNYESMCTFLAPKNRCVMSMDENTVWRHHGEYWDTYWRDSEIFGKFSKDELKEFIKCSQFIQGEGLRYALEANRRRMFRCCGNIIWQFNEPWPNVSGTNVLDYYCQPKLAYYMLQDAYRPLNPTLEYSKLVYNKGESFVGRLYVINDLQQEQEMLHCVVRDMNGKAVLEEVIDVEIPENGCVYVGEISFTIGDSKSYVISLTFKDQNVSSEYCILVKNESGFASKTEACKFFDKYIYVKKDF